MKCLCCGNKMNAVGEVGSVTISKCSACGFTMNQVDVIKDEDPFALTQELSLIENRRPLYG
jgi:hypothetical protein